MSYLNQAVIDIHAVVSQLTEEFKSDGGRIVKDLIDIADRINLLIEDTKES